MAKEIRFGDFIREVSLKQHEISYNDLIPEEIPSALKKANGQSYPKSPRLELSTLDIYRLLKPYFSIRFIDQLKAVVPLALYLILFQMVVLRQSINDLGPISGGLFSVILGLMLFLEGLKLGLMPFSETLGNALPSKAHLGTVLLITFLLGIGVTFAEPAIGALKTVSTMVNVQDSPYLYALLHSWSQVLVLVVGGGVGLASVLGTLSFIYGWNIKPLIFAAVVPTLGVSSCFLKNDELRKILALAWDCGAITTGPVTVPLVLALGIGVASSAGKKTTTISGFGIVTLASLFPILGVLLLTLFIVHTTSAQEIIQSTLQNQNISQNPALPWFERSPHLEIRLSFQAIIPLVLFLFLILKVVLKERLRNAGIIFYGITLCILGMILFNLGLTYGLSKLGSQSGGYVPAAFSKIPTVLESPLYMKEVGIAVSLLFAWTLGAGATLAEPALNAMGYTIENLTNGAFRKSLLLYATSFGVGIGTLLGVLKIIFGFSLGLILIPGYLLALILTLFTQEDLVALTWDAAGVTTGPVTVPLVLAMGLGLGDVMKTNGLGILAVASLMPILSVLICCLWIQWKIKKRKGL